MGREHVAVLTLTALLVGLLVYAMWALSVTATIPRSDAARHEFVKLMACPSTGTHALPCPGYIIDHLVPLCWGGVDAASNMTWQNAADAKKKDVFEKQACALKKKCAAP